MASSPPPRERRAPGRPQAARGLLDRRAAYSGPLAAPAFACTFFDARWALAFSANDSPDDATVCPLLDFARQPVLATAVGVDLELGVGRPLDEALRRPLRVAVA